MTSHLKPLSLFLIFISIVFSGRNFAKSINMVSASVQQFQTSDLKAKKTSWGFQNKIETEGDKNAVALRKHNDDGVHTFRIPALETTKNGTLIAVYDVLRNSKDHRKTWQTVKILNSGASAYSDLTLIDKNTLGCLYEGGRFGPYVRNCFYYLYYKIKLL